MADKKISALTAATTPLAGTEVLPIVQSGSTVKVANNDLRPKQIQSNATSGVLQVVGPAAAATRVMTTPDANFTIARTDAGQTFTGDQTISGLLGINAVANEYLTVGGAVRAQSNALNWTASAGALMDYNAGTARFVASNGATAGYFTLDTSNNITGYGNLVQGTAAKGINFTANTPAAGMTSQLLNWYEEGSFTPTYEPQTGAFTSVTYNGTITVGRYTRVGNMVHIQLAIRTDAITVGTASGFVAIGGLPFTSASGPAYTSLTISRAEGFGGDTPCAAMTDNPGTRAWLVYRTTANGATTFLDVTDLDTGSAANVLYVAGSYRV